MAITEISNDQWYNEFYDLPCGLYYYFMSDTLSGWDSKDTSILGNCPGIQSVQYTPFITESDLNMFKIPYDVERFGAIEELRPGLSQTPSVYRINYIQNKIKEIGSFDIYKVNKSIGGKKSYKNESRLYNYPYSFAMLTDHLNPPIEIKYHLINDNDNNAKVKVRSTISDRCSYGIYIEGYKNDMVGDLESMVSGDAHELPCSSSAYNQWFASNKNQTANQVKMVSQNSFLTKQTNRQMLLPSTLGAFSSTTLNPMSILGSSANMLGNMINYNATNNRANLDVQQAIQSKIAQSQDMLSTPNTMISMGSDVYYGLDKGQRKVTLYRFGLHHEQLQKIGDYFAMFGYKQNKILTPNIRNRHYYNYIKMVGVNIKSNWIPRNHLEQLKEIFDKGVTVWHVDRENVTVGDYSMDNFEV